MTNHNRKGKSASADRISPDSVREEIEAFLRSCRCPAVVEPGDAVVRLQTGEYSLEVRGGRLWFETWSDVHNISRRLTAVVRRSPGVLDCSIQRFAGETGTLSFLDLERPQTAVRLLSGTRSSFAEQFRRMLFRQFPGWAIRSLSTGMDLQRSFSPVFPRAELRRGNQKIAAVACPSDPDEATLLTFALLWFDHIRGRGSADQRTSLCLFFPENAGCLTAHRLHWLDRDVLRPRLFRFNEHGSAGEVDGADLGNLATRVCPHYREPVLSPALQGILASFISSDPAVSSSPDLDGSVSLCYRGLPVATFSGDTIRTGFTEKREVPTHRASQEIELLLAEMRRISEAPKNGYPTGGDSLWAGTVEASLEGAVRNNTAALDPLLREHPVHRQVITFAGTERNAIDLLGIRQDGQLVVVELKGSEDIHLPLQALDYWMRVNWHAQAQELAHLFPGRCIRDLPARLLLVAPALSFHSTHESILRYFSPAVDVERIGIGAPWTERFTVLTRLRRADLPQSHHESHEHRGVSPHQEGFVEPES